MNTPSDIISDDEIIRVHGYANFGSIKPRQVVDETVLKYALGYDSGSTAMAIVAQHGLIRKPKPMSTKCELTSKGFLYLRARFGQHIDAIIKL